MTNQNILFEMGMQQQYQVGSGGSVGGGGRHVVSGATPHIPTPQMNEDADMLADLYKALKKDGKLTKKDFAALEATDIAADNASIKVDPITGDAKIKQKDGKEFEIKFR